MSEILKVVGIALITAIASIIVRITKPELSFAVTITGIIVILFFLLDSLQETFAIFSSLASMTGMGNELIKTLLKIVGVGYITEFGAGILSDFGSASLADKVVLGGKILIISLSFPIIESLLVMIQGFLKLL